MSSANKAWQARDYERCQALFGRIVNTYGPRAPMLYGPKFGVIYYRKGLSELMMASIAKRGNDLKSAKDWYSAAAESFKECNIKYPSGAEGMAKTLNTAEKKALQKWAEACMGLRDYEKALELYKKFLKERSNLDAILPSQGGFYINLAICNFLKKEPDMEKGIFNFETAIKNKDKMKTSESGIVAGFLAFSQGVIVKQDEQAMVDFCAKNRADITLEPYQMFEFVPLFMKLAANAVEAEMYIAAFNLYAMIPGSDEVLQDIKVRVDQLHGRNGIKDGSNVLELNRLEKSSAKIQKMQSEGASYDAQTLNAMAFLHDHAKNQRGVYGVLDQLERYYKTNKRREDNLFNLVRVSSIIGKIFETESYGRRFIQAFPESDKVESVERMMLSSLFFAGEYEKSLQVAKKIFATVQENTEPHDICTFVLAGSHFYLGQFTEAQPLLDKHLEMYPESKFIMHSQYFQASNQVRLQEWKNAAELLGAFMEKYPDKGVNIYLSNALFDRATCYFSEGEKPPALEAIEKIENDFPESMVVDMAFNMKGNIYEADGKLDEAEQYYKRALVLAEKRGHSVVAGESLSNLVGMLGMEKIDKKPNPRIKDAVPYYDKFMKDYSSSPYKPQVAVYGMPAMSAVGRLEEGLDNLQVTISDLAGKKNQTFLEEAVNEYSKAFLAKEGNTPEMLKDLYYNFPGIDLADQRALALLRIAIIGVYEGAIQKAIAERNEDQKRKYESGIKTLFADLKNEYKPVDLSNTILLRLGDYLREKTSAPKQSVAYYEELLSRPNKYGEFKARLGIADVLGLSDSKEDNQKAITQLNEVYNRAKEERATQEKALFRLVEINAKMGDWKGCEKKARQYLEEKFSKKTAMVSYLFAKSYDKRKMVNDALVNYSMVYARYPGYIAISAPSVKRVMEMMWDRDLPKGAMIGDGPKAIKLTEGDRQNAYSGIGWKYIASTTRIRETNAKLSDFEIQEWDAVAALVKQYENSGVVKTVEQLKEERLNSRRGRE